MAISYGDLKKGMAIDLDGEPHVVVDYERSKMQQRAPTMRIRLKGIRTGKVIDKTFSGYDVKLETAEVERCDAQYIYREDDLYYFMDTESFEQFPLSTTQLGDVTKFLVEQVEVQLVLHEGTPIAVDLPITVDLKIAETGPSFKGDTAQGGTKPATLETGLIVNIPLFVGQGETVKIDTRNGEYLSRV